MATNVPSQGELSSSSSDSSCSYSSSLKTHVPIRTSEWTVRHLNDIGVFYCDKASNLEDIFTHLRKRVEKRGLHELPEISKRLVNVVKKIWTFSVDFSESDADIRFVALKKTDSIMENLESEEQILKKQFNLGHEERLFNACISNLIAFWRSLKIFIARWTTVKERKSQFMHLFQSFSRISLMDPEPGDEGEGNFKVKGVTICGFPDICYNSFPCGPEGIEGPLQLIAVVTEGKCVDAFHGEFTAKTFSANNLNEKIVGKHGMDLLMEQTGLFFSPGTAGIICLGTKIVFTYLEVQQRQHHYSMIQKKGGTIDKSHKSHILYTRPYDFMDVCDRNEMLEFLFWLGYVQSSAYKALHIQKI